MFGFQRIGDLIWAAADSRSRGFLLGATAGRTTLSGEGLQHQDGTSHLAASTIPTCRAYDPCFGYELAVIMQDGMRRMLDAQEDIFYYVTVMNENYVHPGMPDGAAEGILQGMYLLQPRDGAQVQLLGSGTILREALAAADVLERDHGVAANVWSITSWTELRWDGMECERARRLGAVIPADAGIQTGARPDPGVFRDDASSARVAWVERCLAPTAGPIVAASDYVRAVPDLVRPYLPGGRDYVALGTDGFGRSDTRAALRAFFEVDRAAIVQAALAALGRDAGREGPAGPAPWRR
jgi:pyruvate dehydrogenase E1 component